MNHSTTPTTSSSKNLSARTAGPDGRPARRSLPARVGRLIGAGAAATALFAAVPTAAHADVNVGLCVVVLGINTCPTTPPAVTTPVVAATVAATVAVPAPTTPPAPAPTAAPIVVALPNLPVVGTVVPPIVIPVPAAPAAPVVGNGGGTPPVQVSVALPVLPVDVCANVAGIATAQVNNCPNGTPNPTGGVLPVNASVNVDTSAVVASPILAPVAPVIAGIDTVDSVNVSPSAIDANLCLTGAVLAQNMAAACPTAPATTGTGTGTGLIPSVGVDVCANIAVGATAPASCTTGTGTNGGIDVNACVNVAIGGTLPSSCTTGTGTIDACVNVAIGSTPPANCSTTTTTPGGPTTTTPGGTTTTLPGGTTTTLPGGSTDTTLAIGTGVGTDGGTSGTGGAGGVLPGSQNFVPTQSDAGNDSLPTTGIAIFGLLLLAGILITTGAGTKALALVTRRRSN